MIAASGRRLNGRSISVREPFLSKLHTAFVAKPLKALARRLLRLLCYRGRYGMMYFYFYSYLISTSAYVVAKLGIPDLLKDGPKTCGELAELVEADEATVYRLMRALAGFNVFEQREDGTFALTPLGELLRTDDPDSLYYWALHFGDDVLPALPELHAQAKTGARAFKSAHGVDMWQYVSSDERRQRNFDKKMSLFTERHVDAIVSAYDFSAHHTIVDVGGGRGRLVGRILQKHPHLNGILYDRPEVTPEARRQLEQSGLSGRCRVQSGSFLESVPAGADAYILKHVCHDWDDENVRRILGNCREAMQPGDRLYIMEGFVEHNLFGWDGYRRWCDVYQMMCLLGKERTLEQFDELLGQAGFEIRSLTPTSIVDVAVLETVAVDRRSARAEPAAVASGETTV